MNPPELLKGGGVTLALVIRPLKLFYVRLSQGVVYILYFPNLCIPFLQVMSVMMMVRNHRLGILRFFCLIQSFSLRRRPNLRGHKPIPGTTRGECQLEIPFSLGGGGGGGGGIK